MSFVRAYVVRNLTVRAAAEQLADEYDVTLPPSYDQALRDLETQLAGFPEDRIDEVMEVESVTAVRPGGRDRGRRRPAGRGGHDRRRRRHQAGARRGRPAAVDRRARRRHQPEVRHRGQHPEPRRTDLRRHQHVVRAERQRGRRRQGRAGPGARRHAAQLAALRLSPVSDPLAEFAAEMRRLRAECAWKSEQTHESLRALPPRGDLRDPRGDRHRRPGAPARGARRPAAADLLPRRDRGGGGRVHLRRGRPGIVDKLRRRNPHVFAPTG